AVEERPRSDSVDSGIRARGLLRSRASLQARGYDLRPRVRRIIQPLSIHWRLRVAGAAGFLAADGFPRPVAAPPEAAPSEEVAGTAPVPPNVGRSALRTAGTPPTG